MGQEGRGGRGGGDREDDWATGRGGDNPGWRTVVAGGLVMVEAWDAGLELDRGVAKGCRPIGHRVCKLGGLDGRDSEKPAVEGVDGDKEGDVVDESGSVGSSGAGGVGLNEDGGAGRLEDRGQAARGLEELGGGGAMQGNGRFGELGVETKDGRSGRAGWGFGDVGLGSMRSSILCSEGPH